MNEQKKPFGKFTLDQLRQLVNELQPLEELKKGLFDTFRDNPEKLQAILTPNFSWARYYELPYPEHLANALVAMSLAPMFQTAAHSDDPQQVILDAMHKEIPDGVGGLDDEPQWQRLLGLLMSIIKNHESVMIYGRYLNNLVEDVRAGQDKSLFDAVRIDRSIVSAPTIADRVTKAEIDGDEAFFKKLRNALTGKTDKQWAIYKRLRFVLQALHEAGVIDTLSDKEIEELFIKQLKLYPDKSTDSIRGLRNLVNARKKKSRI